MKYAYATVNELIDHLYDTMMDLSAHKDNWRLKAEDKKRLDTACSELNIVIDHLITEVTEE